MALYPKLILDALEKVRYPGNGKNLVEADMVDDNIRIDGNKVSFSLIFEKPTDPFIRSVVKSAEAAILTYVGREVEIVGNISVVSRQQARPEVGKFLPQVKNVIAISSGKGGVGKSTVSANLAIALARLGYKVGLLDADIFGPSIPKMFSVEDERPYSENIGGRDLIIPVEKYGVKILSIGFFVDPEQAILWRGGMASNALKQLIADANWGELDYFLIDLPPGTSDIHLTIVQSLSLTGALVVTTPQEVALAAAIKGVNMFVKRESWRSCIGRCREYGVVYPCRASRKSLLHIRARWWQTHGRYIRNTAHRTDSSCAEYMREWRCRAADSNEGRYSRRTGFLGSCSLTCRADEPTQ